MWRATSVTIAAALKRPRAHRKSTGSPSNGSIDALNIGQSYDSAPGGTAGTKSAPATVPAANIPPRGANRKT